MDRGIVTDRRAGTRFDRDPVGDVDARAMTRIPPADRAAASL
jgi:hypothetical protein